MRRFLIAVFLTLLAVLGWGAPVAAHADLQGSTPESGAVLAAFPPSVTLSFTETVDVVFVSMELSRGTPDSPGEVIASLDRATSEPGTTVEFRLPATTTAPTESGPYFAHWRYYGLDGHTMEGYVSFSVGTPSSQPGAPTTSAQTPPESSAGGQLSVLYPALRAGARLFAFLGAALLVGAWFWSRQRAIDVLDHQLAPVWDLARRVAAVVAAGATTVVVIASVLGAHDAGVRSLDALAQLVSSQAVMGWVFAAILAVLSYRQWWPVLPTAVAVAFAAALSSHAADQNWAPVSILFAAAHVVALTAWAGPLFALGWLRAAQTGFRAHPALPTLLRDGLVRFTVWSQAAVGVLVVSGLRQALVIADGVPDGIWGRYLLVKLVLAALCVVPFGVFHHLSIKRADRGGEPMPVLRATLWLEGAGVAVVMLAASVLAATAA